jgi:predicted ATPase
MQATLDWSYGTLPEAERLVLRHLAVFDGGADLAAIRAVAADATMEPVAVVANLALLVDKSLVVAEISGAAVRYRLLDITRNYALDKLTASGELAVVTRRHAEWFSAAAAGFLGGRQRQARRIHGGSREHSGGAGLGSVVGWRCGVCFNADTCVCRAVDGAVFAWRMPCAGWHCVDFARAGRGT